MVSVRAIEVTKIRELSEIGGNTFSKNRNLVYELYTLAWCHNLRFFVHIIGYFLGLRHELGDSLTPFGKCCGNMRKVSLT